MRRLRRQRRAQDLGGAGADAGRLPARGVHPQFKTRVDHRRYNGASLLGLRGIVVKSHGSADAFAFGFAIERACEEVRNGLLDRIRERMDSTTSPAPVAEAVAS